jgi:hypothetical protein
MVYAMICCHSAAVFLLRTGCVGGRSPPPPPTVEEEEDDDDKIRVLLLLLILLLSPAFHRDSRESTTFIFSVTIPYAANTISQLLLLLLLLMLFLADLFLLLLLMLLLMMLLMLQKSEESSSDIVNRLFGKGDIHFNDIADVLVLPVLILLLFVIFDYSSAVFFFKLLLKVSIEDGICFSCLF